MSNSEVLVLGLGASAVIWFAVFEVLRRRPGTSEDRSNHLAIAGALGTFLLMTGALGVALKHWL